VRSVFKIANGFLRNMRQTNSRDLYAQIVTYVPGDSGISEGGLTHILEVSGKIVSLSPNLLPPLKEERNG